MQQNKKVLICIVIIELNNCNSELSTVTSKLNNVGSEASVQYRIDTYYTEMKEYEARWQNGE